MPADSGNDKGVRQRAEGDDRLVLIVVYQGRCASRGRPFALLSRPAASLPSPLCCRAVKAANLVTPCGSPSSVSSN